MIQDSENPMLLLKLLHFLKFSIEIIGIGGLGISISSLMHGSEWFIRVIIGLFTIYLMYLKYKKEFKE